MWTRRWLRSCAVPWMCSLRRLKTSPTQPTRLMRTGRGYCCWQRDSGTNWASSLRWGPAWWVQLTRLICLYLVICPCHLSVLLPVHHVTFPSWYPSIMSPIHAVCHLSIMTLIHHYTHLSSCHLSITTPVHYVTCPSCHLCTMSPVHVICTSCHLPSCHLYIMSPVHHVTCPSLTSPVHRVTCTERQTIYCQMYAFCVTNICFTECDCHWLWLCVTACDCHSLWLSVTACKNMSLTVTVWCFGSGAEGPGEFTHAADGDGHSKDTSSFKELEEPGEEDLMGQFSPEPL